MPILLTVEQKALQELARALKEHEDGKKIRRELAKNLREALQPAITQIKAGLWGVGSGDIKPDGEPLRTAVAKNIKAEARLTGRSTGARVRAKKTPHVRGFANAPKRLNRRKGWRHPLFGHNIWVQQMGNPGYFDDPLQERRDDYRKAILQVMEDTAKKIAAKGA